MGSCVACTSATHHICVFAPIFRYMCNKIKTTTTTTLNNNNNNNNNNAKHQRDYDNKLCPPERAPGFYSHQSDMLNSSGARAWDSNRFARDFDYFGHRFALLSSIGSAGLVSLRDVLLHAPTYLCASICMCMCMCVVAAHVNQ